MQAALKPNLFVIGSMKSGTTHLWNLLSSHPSIFMSSYKEPCYFVDPSQLKILSRDIWEKGYWRSEEDYLSLFQAAGSVKVLGEASVYYSHLPFFTGVSERISRFNPDARLIYLMRDPVERTISHYWERVRWSGEYRRPIDAVKYEPSYRDVSYYAMQLAPYFKRFEREQIKLITFEELINNSSQVILSIYRWLGLDEWNPTVDGKPRNVTPEIVMQPILSGALHRLRNDNSFFRFAVDCLPNSVKRIVGRMLRTQQSRVHVDTSEVVEYLRPLQRKQTQELTRLIGREFPEWTTLNPRDL